LRGLHTQHISSGGALVRTNHLQPLGTNVEVTLILPLDRLKKINSNLVNVNISGQVIRLEDDGMVIGFEKNCLISQSDETKSSNKNLGNYPPSIILTSRENQVLKMICSGFV